MTREEIRAVIAERLGRWTTRLAEQHSTPIFLIGVGHDHTKGQLTLLIPEDLSDHQALLFARYAAAELERRARR